MATVLMLPTTAMCRQQRRCVTLRDVRFADGACSPTGSTSLMLSPSSSVTLANTASLRSPVANTAASFMVPTGRQAKRRCHTVTTSAFTNFEADGSNEASQQANRSTRRAKTLGAQVTKDISVSVVAPGGGTGINSSVYDALAKKEGFSVKILGQSRAPYDRYPASWAQEGAPAPNLESFALDLLKGGTIEKTDCLVVGSRGGQVVLPTFWATRGADVPPVVVMNGGCAMNMPTAVHWPEAAVSFLLLGGQDYFRGQLPINGYVKDAKSRVPKANSTTAILFVNEMPHMPQTHLLAAILHLMIRAATSWKRSGDIPTDDFQTILTSLRRGGWSGNLSFKAEVGDAWQTEAFP